MSVFDIVTGRVLTKYEANADGQLGVIDKLKRADDERAKAAINANKSISESIDDLVGVYGKAAGAVAAAIGAGKMAVGVLRDVANEARLSAAAQNISISAVSAATKGLRLEMDLLKDAAKLNAGEFKLTTEQVSTAEQAMIQLARRGHDAAEANRAITDAIVKLKVDALGDLGIHVDKAGLSLEKEADRAELLKRVLGELTKVSSDFGSTQLTVAEKTEVAANRIEDAIDKAQRKVKSLIADIGQGLGISVAAGVKNLRQQLGDDSWDDPSQNPSAIYADIATEGTRLRGLGQAAAAADRGDFAAVRALGYNVRDPKGYTVTRDEAQTKTTPPPAVASSSSAARAALTAAQALAQFANATSEENDIGVGLYSGGLGAAAANDNASVFGEDVTKRLGLEEQRRQWASNALGEEADRAAAAKRTTLLESTIGPLGQFDAYKEAWQGLTGAVVAGYNAMVDGSMSFGKAFKQAIAGALKATGAQMLIESLKETAAGFASLALGPIGGTSAAGHFKAAALYGAGAIAAGVAASALGGGGGAVSAGAGGGAGAAPTIGGSSAGARNDNAGQPVVMIIGDRYDMETDPRRRENNARRAVEQWMPTAAGGAY